MGGWQQIQEKGKMKKHFFESSDHYIQRLIRTLNDKDKDDSVRLASAKALGSIKDKRAVNALLKALDHFYYWHPKFADVIEEALCEIGDPDALMPLIEKMQAGFGSGSGRRASYPLIKAVVSFGDERATDVLIKALRHDTQLDYPDTVIDGLVRIGKPAVEKIKNTIQDLQSYNSTWGWEKSIERLQTALRRIG